MPSKRKAPGSDSESDLDLEQIAEAAEEDAASEVSSEEEESEDGPPSPPPEPEVASLPKPARKKQVAKGLDAQTIILSKGSLELPPVVNG